MRIIADLHIHSKYSRAVSPTMDLEHLDLWAGKKGITVMGTGDFTHPAWYKDLKEKLEPAEPGLYILKKQYRMRQQGLPIRFLLTVEISSIYKNKGKTRRVHNIIFAPSIEVVEKINNQLSLRGNIASDGRPILGTSSKELLKIVLSIDSTCFFVPAHAWTPWFSIFGSKSGYDSIEECFDELTPHIKAIETGLSSDPAMNWRLSALDNIALISNSDSHSPSRIGREANVLDTDLSYEGIIKAIESGGVSSGKTPSSSTGGVEEGGDPKFLFTVEFFPQEGRYHYDGHRNCKVCLKPEESKKQKNICPKCGRPLTIGVLYRIEELADRPEGYKKPGAVPFKSLIPLEEIIGDAVGVGPKSKKVQEIYENMVQNLGSEFSVLIEKSISDIESIAGSVVAEGVRRVREGEVSIEPGYDGEYGKIKIFASDKDRVAADTQESLF